MENFFNSIGKKVRDTAVAGAITVAAISSGDKGFFQNHEIDSVDLKIKMSFIWSLKSMSKRFTIKKKKKMIKILIIGVFGWFA